MHTHNKLVRDNIPDIIKKEGRTVKTHTATTEEYESRLLEKLREEAAEFANAASKEEMADILEVVDEILKQYGWTIAEVEAVKNEKRAEKGGFTKKIILEETS